jgi:hypothetical protein
MPMSDKSGDDFDPRFDPAFQRGFDGEGLRAPGRPVDAPPAAPPIALPPTPAGAGESVPSSLQAADAAADDDRQPRRNPFLIALAVVSVALVVAGVWIIQIARAPFDGTNAAANVDFVFLQILGGLAPAAIALGVATAIGIVFVLAVDWQKRR